MSSNHEGNIYNRAYPGLAGFALGMAVMYMSDPVAGGRRRALVRDKASRAMHQSRDFLGRAGSDLKHRAEGMAASVKHRFAHGTVDDSALEERVRAKLGHYVSHPRSIEVSTDAGWVTLSGPILAAEVPGLLRALGRVAGVRTVDNQLEAHETADIPELQGGIAPPGEPGMHLRWSPGMQLLTGVALATTLAASTLLRSSHEKEAQSV